MIRIITHPITVLVITLLVLGLCASLYMSGQAIRRSGQTISALQHEVDSAQQDVSKLNQAIQNSSSDLAKEKIIRDQLLMQKPGEYVVQIPELPPLVTDDQTTTTPPSPWEQWRQVLF